MTTRQWRTLQLGLAWSRESRSLSVRDWLAKLDLDRTADSLPLLNPLETSRPRNWKSAAVRYAGMAAALIVSLGLWAAFNRASFGVNTGPRRSCMLQSQSLNRRRLNLS